MVSVGNMSFSWIGIIPSHLWQMILFHVDFLFGFLILLLTMCIQSIPTVHSENSAW
jgi:hypothetical protein